MYETSVQTLLLQPLARRNQPVTNCVLRTLVRRLDVVAHVVPNLHGRGLAQPRSVGGIQRRKRGTLQRGLGVVALALALPGARAETKSGYGGEGKVRLTSQLPLSTWSAACTHVASARTYILSNSACLASPAIWVRTVGETVRIFSYE